MNNLEPLLESLTRRLRLGPRRLKAVMQSVPLGQGFSERLARALRLRVDLPAAELERLPKQGPMLLVCNRPYGLLEACALWPLLRERRADLLVLEDALMEAGGEPATLAPGGYFERLAAAERHLAGGGAVLAMVGRALGRGRLDGAADKAEARSLARLARHASAGVQVIHLSGGRRRRWLRAFGLDKPGLRRLALSPAFGGLGPRLEARLGTVLQPQRLQAMPQEADAGELLALRIWLLAHRGRLVAASSSWSRRLRLWRQRPLASPLPPDLLERELEALPEESKLAVSGDLECWVAEAGQIPSLLREIGRLREETFRAVGEGTGQPVDLDRFDQHYNHLFLWHRRQRRLVGAYRFTPMDRALGLHGLEGLYTHTLLRFKPELINELDPALELGRSFVVPDFQRSYAPLLLLWKGLGGWVAAHPRYRRLFGVVSMSAEYQPLSRELVASFIKQHLYRGDLARLTRPRRPYGPAYAESKHDPLTWRLGARMEEMSDWVAELEPDGKGVPVLFRQYAKLGGVFFGFNLDPAFGDALDGLVSVDLLKTDERMLARTMGADAAARFLDWHQAKVAR
jgi:putative hemolysin